MVDRVFVHVGLPKTATSYLQTIVWSNREELGARGVVVPGAERRDHLWSSRTVREDPAQDRAPRHHREAWTRVREGLASSPGTGLVSHEFFAAASAEQARRMVADLAPAEVHLVVTAREPLGLFTASWQESLKNGSTTPMPRYARRESSRPTAIWNWRTLDLRLVLERWTTAVPAERVHVIVLDPTAPREDVWHRFADVVGLDPAGIDLGASFPNSSMGVVEAETMRRLNTRLGESLTTAFDKGVYLRTHVADERLVPRGGDRFWPEPDQVEDCRARGRAAVAHLRAADYDVVGDVAHLLVPEELPDRRSTGSVSDAEVAEAALDLAAALLLDVRELRRAAGRRTTATPGGQTSTALTRLRRAAATALHRG